MQAQRCFDSDVNPIRQEIMYWICNHELNKERGNVLRGAIAYRTYIEKKHHRKEMRQLQEV